MAYGKHRTIRSITYERGYRRRRKRVFQKSYAQSTYPLYKTKAMKEKPQEIDFKKQTSEFATPIDSWEERFDKLPLGITRGVNIKVGDEIQGIEMDARAELKSFIKSELSTSHNQGYKSAVEKIKAIASFAECENPGEGKNSRAYYYHFTSQDLNALLSHLDDEKKI